jgi:hypothetical protein
MESMSDKQLKSILVPLVVQNDAELLFRITKKRENIITQT